MTSGDGGTTFVAMEMIRGAVLGTKDGPFRQESVTRNVCSHLIKIYNCRDEHVDTIQISNGSDVLQITHTGSGGGEGRGMGSRSHALIVDVCL